VVANDAEIGQIILTQIGILVGMGKTLTIWDCDSETRLKMRLLCIARQVPMAKLLKQLVAQAYEKETSVISHEMKRKARRLIKKWNP